MKKFTKVSMIALSGILLSAGTLTAQAEAGDGTTTGKVQFGAPSDSSTGNITKPDTPEEEIEIETGNYTKGPLRLTHVPDFDFSKIEVSSETDQYPALFEQYINSTMDEKAAISHFVQVEDLRGGTDLGWKLNVSATKFKTAEGLTLDNSAVFLKEGKFFNTRFDAAALATRIDGFTANTKIPTTEEGIEIMKTLPNQSTNSTKTSLVFNNNYTDENVTGGASDGFNPGVKLEVIGNDLKAKDVDYTSTLTWTLVSAK